MITILMGRFKAPFFKCWILVFPQADNPKRTSSYSYRPLGYRYQAK